VGNSFLAIRRRIMIIGIISIVVTAVLIKIAYSYFDKNDKWEHGDQFGNIF